MAHFQFTLCETDDDLAQASLFMLQHIRDVHPSYSMLATTALIYSYLTEGHLVLAKKDGHPVGIGVFFHGTRDDGFADKNVALIDLALSDREYRGSRLFSEGLAFMVHTIAERHPGVREIRLAAQSDNRYLNRLYAKFVEPCGVRDGEWGPETIYAGSVGKIRSVLEKWNRV
ncbi:Acetyltransferase (GNAT) family protein [Cohnella sp. OV330]|uniref:GNAT family N-acetyltransferase n=1 Tax=Cohnella sp. OV330 TaxID=1855288 RepID=UPI0008EC2D15|nr:GNAT family N-acetyltransferase [Cohnella sp. OV330]SFA78871.1 Acetyltransferase (GNAT) family protein [Cohnella sp. OV330]